MLHMRSIPEDRTTRALIRDEALGLFAAHGPDSVTVRQIATAAGGSEPRPKAIPNAVEGARLISPVIRRTSVPPLVVVPAR